MLCMSYVRGADDDSKTKVTIKSRSCVDDEDNDYYMNDDLYMIHDSTLRWRDRENSGRDRSLGLWDSRELLPVPTGARGAQGELDVQSAGTDRAEQ